MLDTNIASINRPATLAQQAYRAIRKAIRDAVLVQDELYSEAELARSMGISRTPVREALIELAREQLVEIVPQRGFRLRQITPAERAEIFALRQVIEAFSVERLAREATAEHVQQLRQLLQEQAEAIETPSTFLLVDETFHLLMPRLVGLDRTYNMLVTLRGALWLIGSLALQVQERAPGILREHQAIVDAIEAHDPKTAVAAMESHLEASAAAVEVSMNQANET